MKRKLSKIYTPCNWWIYPLILVLCMVFTTCTAQEISSSPQNPIKIIDGDSLEIGGKPVRLMGIDAPEYLQKCKNAKKKKYSCGKESAKYLAKLINDSDITCKVHKKDQYDRNLCTCYIGDMDINAAMVKSGHALVYMESPYQPEQEDAKKHKRGIWRGKFMQPRLFRILKEKEKTN